MSFWLKCSPIIADKSLKVPSVSAQNKKNLLKKTKLIWTKIGQNWPKSATRIMRILHTHAQEILKFDAKHLWSVQSKERWAFHLKSRWGYGKYLAIIVQYWWPGELGVFLELGGFCNFDINSVAQVNLLVLVTWWWLKLKLHDSCQVVQWWWLWEHVGVGELGNFNGFDDLGNSELK